MDDGKAVVGMGESSRRDVDGSGGRGIKPDNTPDRWSLHHGAKCCIDWSACAATRSSPRSAGGFGIVVAGCSSGPETARPSSPRRRPQPTSTSDHPSLPPQAPHAARRGRRLPGWRHDSGRRPVGCHRIPVRTGLPRGEAVDDRSRAAIRSARRAVPRRPCRPPTPAGPGSFDMPWSQLTPAPGRR